MVVTVVLFDLDDTLCEYRQSGRELLALAFERENVEPFFDVEEYQTRFNEFAETTESMKELRASCFAAIAEERGRDPTLGRAIATAYADERDHRDVRPLQGVPETIAALAHEYRLGIVTNGPPDSQAPKLAAIGRTDAFDAVIHAGHDAPSKPDPEPFYQALSALDTAPESAVFVGNSLSSDVAGAQAAGLQAIWLAESDGMVPDAGPVPEYTIESISELNDPPWR